MLHVLAGCDFSNTFPTTQGVRPATVCFVTHDVAEAVRLRTELVDRLRRAGLVRTAAVEDVLRTVPRHLFVPDAPLAEAYGNAPVSIKDDAEGTSISCASQPGVVAGMLEQLDVRPGQRILEIGAGTGYNAGLLARLAGPGGRVVTLDVDEDLVAGARANLAAGGLPGVEVARRDGALGYAEAAPYDRIVATVGAHGVPHAWLEQLAPGGRLVTPQRLRGSVCRTIAFERHGERWRSVGSRMNTFMPLRDGIADDGRRVVPLSADGDVRLQVPAAVEVDPRALAGVLDRPRVLEWTGVTLLGTESPEWLELFVACAVASGLNRMLFPPEAVGRLLVDRPYGSSSAAVSGGALAYLARRPTTAGWEFGVAGHGPGCETLVASVAAAVRDWDSGHRGREAGFEILPLGATAPAGPGRVVLDTPPNRVVVDWRAGGYPHPGPVAYPIVG